VDDRLGRERGHGLGQRVGVEDVADDGLGAELAQHPGLGLAAGHARDRVPVGGEEPHERHPDGARGAGDEDPHA
jgi:hypothetical protein